MVDEEDKDSVAASKKQKRSASPRRKQQGCCKHDTNKPSYSEVFLFSLETRFCYEAYFCFKIVFKENEDLIE
jgi:hypothetical protein